MTHSETIGAIAKALAMAQAEYAPVPKNKTAKVKMKAGGEFSYNYADLADCLSMALPRLSKNGIAFCQPHIMEAGKLRVVTLLIHESGEWLQSDGIEISEIGEPQQFGAESTYFRRYDGCSFIGVAPDEDTDAQQTGNRSRRTTPAQAMQNSSIPPPDYEPDLPSEKISQQPASPQTKTTAQPPTGQPAAAQGASQSRVGPTKRIPPSPPDNLPGLLCTVKKIEEAPKKGNVNARIRVTLDAALDGSNQGVKWVCQYATCWHEHLFDAVRASVGKELMFAIKESDKKLNNSDEFPTHFLAIEDVWAIDGQLYHEGKPVVEGAV